MYITTQDVWFNTNANATADDSGWAKFTLKTPVTIDLVQESNGTLGQIAGDLQLAAGTYNTILLMPLPNTTDGTATTSATALGAANNLEAVSFSAESLNSFHQIVPSKVASAHAIAEARKKKNQASGMTHRE